MSESLTIETIQDKRCISKLWINAYRDDNNPSLVRFLGNRDTRAIKGVLVVLMHLTGGKTAQGIEELDVDGFYKKLELEEYLLPNRHIGDHAIVELMKRETRRLA